MNLNTIAIFLLWCLYVDGDDHTDAMKTMSYTFSRKLYECNKRWPLREDIINDFLHFWQLNNVLNKRAIGCAMVCIAAKLHFVDSDGNFLAENAQGFAIASGAGNYF
ncbi:unnamed protein product [Diatraea saccharalis]|uniref:Uncharacterized protein n=1 Tax=Diatraea saccharalis TaxID=40085 RepID=A0A9N9RGY4_9NEOP|nr:unnamed protein product [Diatraea saccharalis]